MKIKRVYKVFITVGLFFIPVLTVFGGNYSNDTIVDQRSDQYPEQYSFFISNDSLNVKIEVVEYSNVIIQYELTIKTKSNKDTIQQKGFAINPHTKVNGDLVYGINNKGEDTGFRVYYSHYCNCDESLSFDFKISTDKELLIIFASRQTKYDLLKDKSILHGNDPRSSVNLFGFIHNEELE